ncbi:hypothetical protein Pint_07685 [Pistacia integerrima]|uniref:Uncharacterized protein n=1 Tax=Pistacia integerrima TaxID=434235 RepID=A0ACC0XW73_9ROSI|nr:hypothetical protein Pint_07685 [Pistacia integerrima]
MLDGGIPANFSSISTLSRLAANQNNFSGSIPSGLTRCIIAEYAYTMGVTAAGNVYGFRVILLELLTRKPPISEGTELAKLVLPNWEHEDININATSLAIKKLDACSRGGCSCLC